MEHEKGFVLNARTLGTLIGTLVGAVSLFGSLFFVVSWFNKMEYKIERSDTAAYQLTETVKEVRSEVKDIKEDFKILRDEMTSIKISLAAMAATSNKGRVND